MNLRWLHITAFVIVVVNWLVFAGFFLLRKRRPRQEAKTSDPRASVPGIVVQGFAYAAVWAMERPRWTSIVPLPRLLELVPPLVAVALSAASTWLTFAALRTLGKEWSLEARLVAGHRLVTAGPYGRVRHPIYTAMCGKLLATGLVVSHWIGLLTGLLLIGIGTAIRVRSEEKLLRAEFGAAFEAYARAVPAIVPHPFARGYTPPA